ncbi:MAG: thiolase family protein, partial [Chloroflexi bacterium]
MDKVAIIGVGQTRYERGNTKSFAELVYEVTRKALDDAGLELDDIDNVVTTTNDFYDGRTIACMAVAEASGSYGRDATNVEGDGTLSAFYGLMRTLSGVYDATIVTTHCKMSEGNPRKLFNQAFDPIYDRILGMDAISSSALQARAYMDRYGVTEEQCAMVSVKNHANARNNPYAHVALEITIDDVMKSPMLAEPIKRLDISPISDGACAIILATEERARKSAKKPVWVRGVAHCTDA